MAQSDGLSQPSWLNDAFVQKVIKNDLNIEPGQYELKSFVVSNASGKNENYMGQLARAHVVIEREGVSEELSYIIKFPPEDEALMGEFNAFPKEIEMYEKIVPGFEAILKEAGLDVKLGPTCYGIFEEAGKSVIVMEDLVKAKYTVLDRVVGLDATHAKLAVEKLALFHAASIIYYEKVSFTQASLLP